MTDVAEIARPPHAGATTMTMADERLAELDAASLAAADSYTDFDNFAGILAHAYPDLRAHIEAQAATIARATEMLAKLIYSEWQGQEGFVPWVENGNSFKQDDARDRARAALTGAA